MFVMYVIYVCVKKFFLFRGIIGNVLKILFKKVLFFDYYILIIDEDFSRKGMECCFQLDIKYFILKK